MMRRLLIAVEFILCLFISLEDQVSLSFYLIAVGMDTPKISYTVISYIHMKAMHQKRTVTTSTTFGPWKAGPLASFRGQKNVHFCLGGNAAEHVMNQHLVPHRRPCNFNKHRTNNIAPAATNAVQSDQGNVQR